MVPHQNTVRSKSFSRRSIPLARAVVATLVLIASAVIGIGSAALAHEIGGSADPLAFHECHTDGCHAAGSLAFHECHTDGCHAAGSLAFHECHTDGCHAAAELHGSPRHQCDHAATAAGVPKPVEAIHPRHGDCHGLAVVPAA